MTERPGVCGVEAALAPEQALELDMLLADPSRWPKAVLEGWSLPAGSVPAGMRLWGAVQLGVAWCAERGIDVNKAAMRRHYEKHVPILPYSPDDMVARAAPPPANAHGRDVVPSGPSTYLDLYQKGISIGAKALDMLSARLDRMTEAGDLPTPELLMQVGNLGVKLATSQAGIISRGFDIARQKEEEMEGFRSASAPEASPRFGDVRVRVIEGEARPVTDRGRADRREYNETARQDGGPLLPA